MTEIVNLISNLGFPIACVVAMFWLLQKEQNSHADETAKFTQTIEANTIAIERLIEKLDAGVIKIEK